jgi:colanic acid biosynthesis glycosyl transferase WcaI
MNGTASRQPSGSPRRRLLVLSQYYHPEIGAAPIRLRSTVRELVRLGLEVRVLTGMPNYPTGRIQPGYRRRLWMRDEVDGVPVRRVWLFPAAGRAAVKRLLNYLSFTTTATLGLVREGNVDLVFVEAQPLTLGVPALLNRWLRGVPYIYNTPDLQVEYAAEDRWVGLRLLITAARCLERLLMRHSLAVATVTHGFIAHFIREHGLSPSQVTFLPNGADVELLRPTPYDASLAAALGLAGRKAITFAGTFAPYQGLEVMVETATLLRHRQDLVLLMVGDGPVKASLEREVTARGLANVIFAPPIPMEQMPALMSISWASVAVLRKLEIAKKMRLAKAIPPLACGVPLVFAGWGETAEIIDREAVGLRVEPENPQAIAAAIVRLADDPPLRTAMSIRARALAERDFAWPVIVESWWRIIEPLLPSR